MIEQKDSDSHSHGFSGDEDFSFESNKAYQFADLIIVFIGVSMFLLPFFSINKAIPSEFIFGATLSSFLLALSDGLIITEKMGMKRFWFYGISFVLGILSIIYVPILLSIYPKVLPKIEPFSDVLTIMALGFVLIVIGYRSFDYKQKIQKNLKDNLAHLTREIEMKKAHLSSIKDAATKMKDQLIEHGKVIDTHETHIKNTLAKLQNENTKLKNKIRELESKKE